MMRAELCLNRVETVRKKSRSWLLRSQGCGDKVMHCEGILPEQRQGMRLWLELRYIRVRPS